MKLLSRQKRFFIIQHLLLPVAMVAARFLWMTYRIAPAEREKLKALVAIDKAIVGSCHGYLLALAPFAKKIVSLGRRLSVLASPSRDGRVGEEALRRLGARAITGSSSSKATAGAAGLARAVAEGDLCLITFDGPRGPRFEPKRGATRLAQMNGARLFCIAASASKSKVFGSWDRMFLPLPFARITVDVREFGFIEGEEEGASLARLEELLRTQAREIGAPIYVSGKDGP